MADKTPPRLDVEDGHPIVPPPASVTVEYQAKPVLHLPNGKVLVRKVGF